MSEPAITIPITCACGTTVQCKSERLPRGWKRRAGIAVCDTCWHKQYSLKAISIPVLKPLGEKVGWKQLREVLAEAWVDSTAMANWLMTEYYARDIRRKPGDEKMPAMPSVYLYPEATKKFPEMPTPAVTGMCQVIGQKYRAKRYEIVWTGASSLPTMRYPYPAAFPAQAWKPSYETAGKDSGDPVPCVSVNFRRGQRFLLQLRGGSEFRRQLRDFKALVDGRGVLSELAFYRQLVGPDHRNGVTARDSGGQKKQYRVMCKMVGWFPKPERHGELSGTLVVKSQPDAMLAALDEKDERLWWVNADHVRRWQAEHKQQLHRWADDEKHELRPGTPIQSRREAASQKNRNRLKSWISETVAQLVGFAVRRRYEALKYDDSNKSYLESFPWAALRDRLETKCAEFSIRYEYASAEATKGRADNARDLAILGEEPV